MADGGRAARVELPIDASLERVWRALVDAEELVRWFPLSVRVEPREGGAMEWKWGDAFTTISRIERFQPPHLLRLVQDRERPHDADGRVVPESAGSPSRVAMEFSLETREGKTWLRLVHSGFGDGAAWDDELEGVTNGWMFELRGLAHYLARHAGRDRHHGWATAVTPRGHPDVWAALLGPGGFRLDPPPLATGSAFSLTLPDGDRLNGTVRLHLPEREFVGVVPELDDGVVRLSTWAGGGSTGVNVWFATYAAEHAARAAALGEKAQRFLDHAFAG